MQTTQPMNTRSTRRPILGFTTMPAPLAPASRETAHTPQHDFLMPNLCPQLTPEFAPPAARAARDQAHAA
jgi:hypothetical protein